jgi:hypothetical protein
MGGTLLVPTIGFSSTPAVGVGDVTTAMWYETNVDEISSADSNDTDRIIGTPLTGLIDEDDDVESVGSAWPMNFFGTKYEGLCISTNGTVSPVADSSTSCSPAYDVGLERLALSNSGAPIIAAFSNDGDPSANVLPDIGISISTIRFSAADSDKRTLTVQTRTSHGISSGTGNLCVLAASSEISNGASETLWRTDEFWYCGTALNASGTQFEMSVPLTFTVGTPQNITNMTTLEITPSFSRLYRSNATALNDDLDTTSYDVERGYDGFGHVSAIYFGTATIRGKEAMVVTWYRVGQYSDDNAKVLTNTYQIVLIKKATTNGLTDGFDFDFEFNFGTVQDGEDGYNAANPSISCSSSSTECRTGVGVAISGAVNREVYELYPDTSSRDLVDWGDSSALTANSLNATVNGVTTLGRYGFTFTGGAPTNFATPVMDGSGQVVGGPVATSPNPASAVYTGPITLSLTPNSAPSGTTFAINGRRLSSVTAVFVGETKVEIISRKATELLVKSPTLAPGKYLVRVVSSQGEYLFDGIRIVSAQTPSAGAPTSSMFPGFAVDSPVLTAAMKKQIRQSISLAPQGASVTCKGFTSGPISLPKDQVLADRRSKAACAFVSSIRPDLSVKALKGKPLRALGLQNQKVRVRILG